MSLLQHHDAITGTEKQHVACDYHRRLHRGECAMRLETVIAIAQLPAGGIHLLWRKPGGLPLRRFRAGLKEAQVVVTSLLEALIRGQYTPGGGPGHHGAADGSSVLASEARTRIGTAASLHRRLQKEEGQARAQPNPVDTPIELEVCDWLNITACNTTGSLNAAVLSHIRPELSGCIILKSPMHTLRIFSE